MNRVDPSDPHAGGRVRGAGAPLEEAKAAIIMIHGRGASAEDILSLAGEVALPGFAFLAPQAAGHTWYPYSFMQPLEQNEPYLSSALKKVGTLVQQVQAYISLQNIILLGFSQGACLTTEFAARNTARYGGVVGFSGGLIGPDGTPRDYEGTLDGTPVFLGCSDVDFHIPKERVLETAEIMSELGGDVTARLYPNMGHTVNQDEIDFLRELMERVLAQ